MNELLLSGDAGQLALMRAIADPAATKVAMDQLLEARRLAEIAQVAASEQEARNREVLAEAGRQHAAAVKMAAEVAARSKELDDREAGLAEVNEALNAEKAAFEEVRIQVRADHAARVAELDGRTAMVAQNEGLLSAAQRDALGMAKANLAEAARLAELREQLEGAVAKLKAGVGNLTDALAEIV